ncbi:MAG: AAA family ATPase [Elusimicrobiota bacterium]|nr:AAA family ATPase [Elusimicrobiota bacterium]
MKRKKRAATKKKERKVKPGVYKANDKITEDFFYMMQLYEDSCRSHEKDNGNSRGEMVKRMLQMGRDIRKKVLEAVSKKRALPVIDMVIKYKISFRTLLIIMYVYFYEAVGRNHNVGIADIIKFFSQGKNKTVVPMLKVFSENAPIFRSGLLVLQQNFSTNELKITPKAKEYLLGCAGRRNRVGHKVKPAVKFGSPRDIYDRLSEYVMGQDEAKKRISVGVFNHLQRISLPDKQKGNIKKSNILMMGPTGSGKTYICEMLAKIMDVPFAVCDATRYSETGYVGGDIDDILRILFNSAKGDAKAAEKGIIYIDEIDKLAGHESHGHYSNKDVSGVSVQQELLRLLEGDKVDAYSFDGRMRAAKRYNTGDIMFICGGAFNGIEDIINRRLKVSGGMGFGTAAAPKLAGGMGKMELCDIEEYGLIPEFLGRFPIITSLSALGRDELVKILTESRNSMFGQYRTLLNINGLSLRIDRKIAYRIADEALSRGYGARGLRQIMEDMLSPILFEKIGSGGSGEIRLTDENLKYG